MKTNRSLIKSEVIPFLVLFSGLILLTICADLLLHQRRIVWVGRYWGYIGTGFIALSFIYSLRKRKIIRFGSPLIYLKIHEYLGWLGALMVLIHGGIHFNGLLAWMAMTAMLVTIISGLTGRVLLKRSKNLLSRKRKSLLESGMDVKEADDKIYWDSIAVDIMKKWRSVHLPITWIFVLLTLIHILVVLLFWRW